MTTMLALADLEIEVLRKNIKNVHLSVLPPKGRVRIAAPERTSLETLRLFAISKLAWIRQEQEKLRRQERESPREYIGRESHYVWGTRYLLEVVEQDAPPQVERKARKLRLQVRPGTDEAKKAAIVAAWYRQQVREAIPPLIAKWQPRLGVEVAAFYVQHMKTKWGSCNPEAKTLRFNTELAKKPRECLEYLVVHEMVHLLEPTHNARFVALMDRFLPQWQERRKILNQLPVRHEHWQY